ncbi:uncharacterized protein LOC62_07G009769 [Vanrija pseudolonga]|uniref:Transcription factor domain-containing protein n=1 Tax=Vanrija pseudolonga TaxID=143232 RepID=A0AAF0YMK2_9TREE|nr:hypothetical protein LOC62_07G009769 [Vanrija pseudolonga]
MPPKRKDADPGLPRPPGTHKRGKRIMTLLQQHHHGDGDSPHSTPEGTPTPPPLLSPSTARFAATFASPAPATPASPHACLLSVPGLTRPALDDAIGTFFRSIGQTYHLSMSERVFTQRVAVLLYEVAGLPPAESVPAVSELLALAVAALGAPLSSHAHLSGAIYARCVELTTDEDVLARGGIDAVEAVNLLAERVAKPRQAHPLRLDPLGRGFAIDLALYHKLHVPPAPSHPEYARRQTLFWTLWKFDAIRSSSASTSFRLVDTNVGWPLPPGADIDIHFAIARVARKICATLLSARAKTEGLKAVDVDAALGELERLDTKLHVSALDHSPHATYLVSTYNWMFLVCWIAVKDYAGVLPRVTVAAVDEAALRATERMAVLARTIADRQLLQLSPRAVRDQLAAFVLFLVRLMVEGAVTSRDVAARYMALAEALVAAVRSASAYPETAMLANVLTDAVYRAVATLPLEASPMPPPAAPTPTPSYPQGWSSVAVSPAVVANDAFLAAPVAPAGVPAVVVPGSSAAAGPHDAPPAEEFVLDQELLDFLSGCGIEIPFFSA